MNIRFAAQMCILFLALVSASCRSSASSGLICTEIGCSDGLAFEINGIAAAGAQVTVTAPGEQPRTFSCAAGAATCRMFYEKFSPTSVTVDVSVAGTHKVTNAQPVYTVTTPNGKDCPPKCTQGKVAVQV